MNMFKTPAPPPEPEMPDPNNPAILQQRRQKMLQVASRGGRDSTDLTGAGAASVAGARSDYTRTQLG